MEEVDSSESEGNELNIKAKEEFDGNSKAKDNEEYVPSQPNVLEILQSSVPRGYTLQPHGQSEVITGPGGRRFIAQLYEHTPASSEEDNANSSHHHLTETASSKGSGSESDYSGDELSTNITPQSNNVLQQQAQTDNDDNDDDGNMARTLCVNLLSELVKGSYQLFKTRGKHLEGYAKREAIHKLNVIKQKCDDMKESLSNESGTSSEGKMSAAIPDDDNGNPILKEEENRSENIEFNTLNKDIIKKPVEVNSKETGCKNSDIKDQGEDCEEGKNYNPQRKRKSDTKGDINNESSSSANFKKAKYGWQIKGNNSNASKGPASQTHRENNQNLHKENKTIHSCDLDSRNTSAQSSTNTANILEPSSNTELTKTEDVVKQENRLQQVIRGSESSSVSSSTKTDPIGGGNCAINSNPSEPVIATVESDDSKEVTQSTNESSAGQAPFTYLERWQNHHIAKAIVDNAINKTLDEMNLGPQDGTQIQTGVSTFSRQRQRIEDAGVSQVILQRGLRRPTGAQSQNQPLLPNTGTINPFINHLTEMTENMFVENLSAGMRLSARIDLGGNIQFDTPSLQPGSSSNNIGSSNLMHESIAASSTSTVIRQVAAGAVSLSNRNMIQEQDMQSEHVFPSSFDNSLRSDNFYHIHKDELCCVDGEEGKRNECSSSLFSSATMCSEISSSSHKCHTKRSSEQMTDSNKGGPNCQAIDSTSEVDRTSASSHFVAKNNDTIKEGEMGTIQSFDASQPNIDVENFEHNEFVHGNRNQSALDVIEEIENSAPSQNFLIDTAVNAVIYEKGLQF